MECRRCNSWSWFITIFGHQQKNQETIHEKNVPVTFTDFVFPILPTQTLFLEPRKLRKIKIRNNIIYIANTLRDYDIVAIQEVVAGDDGAQAMAKLADELNRKGAKWDYTISDPTSSSAYKTERYAFLWKTSKIKKIGRAWLEKKYHLEIEREPFFCTFEYDNKQFTVANFRAITKNRQPET